MTKFTNYAGGSIELPAETPYRFVCGRCGGPQVFQDARVELNTGALVFTDSVWCDTCEDEVDCIENSDAPPVLTDQIEL
jgi:hypothetical protein